MIILYRSPKKNKGRIGSGLHEGPTNNSGAYFFTWESWIVLPYTNLESRRLAWE
jgi:hypothetical protein